MTKVYVFPGQGAQRKGMGGHLFDAFPELIAQADDILGYSIKDLCLNDPHNQLRDTRYTQPAYGIRNVEASAYMQITPALVKYRLRGLERDAQGTLTIANRVLAKVSRPEVAPLFLSPAPERIVKHLLDQQEITAEQAAWSHTVPLADDLCVEADSGGHTDMGVAAVLIPTIIRLRDRMQQESQYARQVRVGAAGGIGTPEAAACAFLLGADFVLTGSINQ